MVNTSHSRIVYNGLMLLSLFVLTLGCTTAELKQLSVDKIKGNYFRYIYVNVDILNPAESTHLRNRIVEKLNQYDLQILKPKREQFDEVNEKPGSAILEIVEIERRLESGKHNVTYGRTALTQNRGRKTHVKPVITLRATLIDTETERKVFQADYVTEGQWYSDSITVVTALAGTLVKKLESENFITK